MSLFLHYHTMLLDFVKNMEIKLINILNSEVTIGLNKLSNYRYKTNIISQIPRFTNFTKVYIFSLETNLLALRQVLMRSSFGTLEKHQTTNQFHQVIKDYLLEKIRVKNTPNMAKEKKTYLLAISDITHT